MLEWELPAIRKVCLHLDKDFNKSIAFLMAPKRHDTHLFPDKHRDEVSVKPVNLVIPKVTTS